MNVAGAFKAAFRRQIQIDRGRLLLHVLNTPACDPERTIARQYDRIVDLEETLALEVALVLDLQHELIAAHEQIRQLELGPVLAEHRNNVPLAQHLAVLHELEQTRHRADELEALFTWRYDA